MKDIMQYQLLTWYYDADHSRTFCVAQGIFSSQLFNDDMCILADSIE